MLSPYRIKINLNEYEGFKKGRLQISVGQSYHEGDKFLATAIWAARNFESISVNLCDTLQRHNFVFHGYTPFDAFDKASLLGYEWMSRNEAALSLLPQLTITHWDSWKEKDGWESAQKITKDLYENDVEFKNIVDMNAEEFWLRRKEKENYTDDRKEKFLYASKQYLLEETAVSMVMSEDDIAEIYPGSFARPLYYLRERNMPAPKSTTTISFLKRKATLANAA